MTAVIEAFKLSKWYGNILGLSEVTISIGPGITGLLGPNGAGKSTFMKLANGLLKPNRGRITVLGQKTWNNPAVFSQVGYCPEFDVFYEYLTGWEFLLWLLRLYYLSPQEAAERALNALKIVELVEDKDRKIKSYSRGMRQRLKLAQAIAHQPEVLILDEPLTGLDPLGKRKMIKLIRQLGSEGKTILVSSHVLPEIEALTASIILIHQGKILAQGDIHYIRELIEAHPHMISIVCDNPRRLATRLMSQPEVLKISLSDKNEIVIETRHRDDFYSHLMEIIIEDKVKVDEIRSPDDNLQAVFDYLVGR